MRAAFETCLILVKPSGSKGGNIGTCGSGPQPAARGSVMNDSEWKIRWNDNLSVGVPEIDEEHQKFIERVNELNTAIVECRDKPTVEHLLDLMLMEASHHFWHEQQLLAKWKYPERAAHAVKHAQLTAQFDRVMKEFERADVSFTWALKGLHIKQLLIDHVLQEDMKYRDFLREKKDLKAGADSSSERHHRQPVTI